ncbi:hypothetical protein BRC62_08095 [Halobacteriales archaeon QH_10_67_13]|nr:MAG: hypothetical protein BRC62_08095 [Halobacteriales archaeon QH_10_67_13]
MSVATSSTARSEELYSFGYVSSSSVPPAVKYPRRNALMLSAGACLTTSGTRADRVPSGVQSKFVSHHRSISWLLMPTS